MEETIQNASKAANQAVAETTNTLMNWLNSFLTWGNLFKLIGAVIFIFILWIIYKVLMRALNKIPKEKITPQRTMIFGKVFKYAFYIITIMYVLSLFGVKFSAIWGAAGIAGVAVGFAAQTSVSNLISGIFVLSEGILKVGDFITVSDSTGIVDSVGLLSVQIHTLDNQLVRIPNSTIINSNLINTSYFPRRRLCISVSVSYDTDMAKALEALNKVPALCSTVLTDPAPAAWFDSFGDSGINLTLAVWFNSADFLKTKNDVFIGIKKIFDEANISIPFNRLDVSVIEGNPKA